MGILSIFPLAGFLLIVILILLKIQVLNKKGVSVTAITKKTNRFTLLLYVLFGLFLFSWLAAITGNIFNLHPFFHSSLLTKQLMQSPLLTATGAILIFLAVVLMGITLAHFKTSFRFGLNSNNKGKLITNGIFAYSRNPFFLSLNLYFIGQAFIFPGILFIATALMAATGIHLFILKEEKFLHINYSHHYLNYRKKVRRYF